MTLTKADKELIRWMKKTEKVIDKVTEELR